MLPADEHFQERAAICEWDGGLPRAEAEALALQEVADRFGDGERRRVAESLARASNERTE